MTRDEKYMKEAMKQAKKALKAGVNFNLLDNVSFWGEDRHFCVRAVALGFDLFVDTVYYIIQ